MHFNLVHTKIVKELLILTAPKKFTWKNWCKMMSRNAGIII